MAPYDVSLIVTAHQQAPLLRDSLTSLTRQFDDPSRLQVILVDDGSTDHPERVAEAFADRLPGLSVLRHETPRGVSAARNTGLSAATGRTVGLLDGDDWFAPGHLQHLLTRLDALGVSHVRCDVIEDNRGSRKLKRAPEPRRERALDPRDCILPPNRSTLVDHASVWAALYRRELVDTGVLTFNEDLPTAEDRLAVWRLMLLTDDVAVVDAPGVIYRRGQSTALTSVTDDRQLGFARAFNEMIALVSADAEAERFLPKVVRQFLAIAAFQLDKGASFDAAMRARLSRVIRTTAEGIDPAVLARTYAQLDLRRRRLLRPHLPSHAGPRVATLAPLALALRPLAAGGTKSGGTNDGRTNGASSPTAAPGPTAPPAAPSAAAPAPTATPGRGTDPATGVGHLPSPTTEKVTA